jgi:hypothetical protein
MVVNEQAHGMHHNNIHVLNVVDMKLTEDGKIDDGDIGDVGGVFGKR